MKREHPSGTRGPHRAGLAACIVWRHVRGHPMHAITGITGRVGGAVARALLAARLPVRAVVRDASKASEWAALGCEIACAAMDDPAALTAAFQGTQGVFVLPPPVFDPAPGFLEARASAAAVRSAIDACRPAGVVCISTIGAQATQPNLLTQLALMEQSLGTLPVAITFLRPGWYMENASWDVAPARKSGMIPSFLQPLDRPVPMVATADVGRVAAELLQQTWSGRRVVELEGPRRVTPNAIASTLETLLGRPVHAEVVPRETWEALFVAQGMKNPEPRMRMLDGFNEGWLEFECGEQGSMKGTTDLETVLRGLL
jgi:NAD(P)H dehydrogenase (quinone)